MAPDRWVVRAHGLCISSVIPLGGSEAESGTPVDLSVDVVESISHPTPEHPVILSYAFPDGRSVVAARRPDGSVVVDFSEQARFMLSPDLDRIAMQMPEAADAGLSEVLLEGWVMSMALMLRGLSVFHATAVEVGESAVAFLANSGMGKSTVAALLCSEGAELISDDVLRVERGGSGQSFDCFPGSGTIRLRPAAAELAATIPGARPEKTPDGRTAVRFTDPLRRVVPISAVLIPMPSRHVAAPAVSWLSPALAAVELGAYPRVYDWKITEPVRSQFAMAADMASSLPVGYLQVPWGPPWRRGLLDEVARLVSERAG